VLYHVGSKDERADRTGFAHFFEHLMFEGSENIPRATIDKLISGAGGNLNASTSFDQTDYFFNLPSNQLQLALWIESERMMHAKIDETGVETQRRSVKEEKRRGVDNQPYGTLFENSPRSSAKAHRTNGCRSARSNTSTRQRSRSSATSTKPTTCRTTRRSRLPATSTSKKRRSSSPIISGRSRKGPEVQRPKIEWKLDVRRRLEGRAQG
jgi:hypothetical protein